MLRTDKPIYKAILVPNLLLIIAGVVSCVLDIVVNSRSVFGIITLLLTVLTLVFAGFYILSGYTKDAAKYFKIYGVLFAIKLLSVLAHCSSIGASTLTIMCQSLSLVIVLVLLLSSNLGKNKSLILCGLLVLIRIFCLVRWIGLGQPLDLFFILTQIADIDLACLYGIMTYAKYLDKAERGTK